MWLVFFIYPPVALGGAARGVGVRHDQHTGGQGGFEIVLAEGGAVGESQALHQLAGLEGFAGGEHCQQLLDWLAQ